MDYRKLFFGASAKNVILAVDDRLSLIAVVSKDGVMKIYSQILGKIHTVNIGTVFKLEFIKGKGSLVAFNDDYKVHILVVEDLEDSFQWTRSSVEFDMNSNISYLHVCQNLIYTENNTTLVPLLIVDCDNLIDFTLINKLEIIRSNKVTVRTSSDISWNKIIQMSEIDNTENNLTVLILWKDEIQLVKFSYCFSNEEETCYISFDLKLIVCSYTNFEEINNFNIFSSNTFVVTTLNGKYGILRYMDDDHGKLIMEEVMFPYGPFPCKSIDKCLMSMVPKLKGECYIFCGGLPAVTYKDLHSLSIAVKDEPEICFTFYDRIIDFDIFQKRNDDGVFRLNEIVLMTETQVVSIINDNGLWQSSNNDHFSFISRSEVLVVSNVIEMNMEFYGVHHGHIYDSAQDIDFSSRIFATFHKDSTMIIWNISEDNCSKHSEINLEVFFNESIKKTKEKVILWPKFQKVGLWKRNEEERDVKTDSLKLLVNDSGRFHLLCVINGSVIFNFRILLKKTETLLQKTLNIKEIHRHINMTLQEDNDPSLEQIKINEEVNIPWSFELCNLVTFNDTVAFSHVDIVGPMLMFGSSNGVGLLDIVTDKHFYISSEDMAVVLSHQTRSSLSELISIRIRKQKTFESTKLKSNLEMKLLNINSKVKALRIISLYLLQKSEICYDLSIGFDNGMVMILVFTSEDNGDINISSTYRSIHSCSKEEVILLSVFNTYILHSPKTSRVKFNLEEYDLIRRSLDSTKEGSISNDSKSTHISSDSDKYQVNSLSRAQSLKWPLRSQKVSSNDMILIRCDKTSIKVIDYLKLKTRFKYKINEQFKKLEDSCEKMSKQTIIQVKVVNGDDDVTKCLVILSNEGLVTKLSLPTLIPIFSCSISEYTSQRGLISINKDVVVIPRNISVNNELISYIIILDQRRQVATKSKGNNKLILFPKKDLYFSKSAFDGDNGEIDFMRGAEQSVTSLLW